MSSHTPGPWRQHPDHPDRIIVNGSCVYQVRDMTTGTLDDFGQPSLSDVALMAAAPELLSSAKELLAAFSQLYIPDSTPTELARAEYARQCVLSLGKVIAKAEGRGE